MSCLFCRMVSGEIPVTRLYDDEDCMAFADIHPQAPVHVLVIPKEHLQSTAHAEASHGPLLGKLMAAAAAVAKGQGLSGGYRLVVNTGDDGGQTVGHLHVHVLGGRHMGWPPG
jgi:histidine triad (HIT) family protein